MSADPTSTQTSTRAGSRRVEPVSEELDPDEIFDPERVARPWLALLLWSGPLLAAFGVLAWLRLVAVVEPDEDFFPWPELAADALLLLAFISTHSLLARGFGRRLLNRPFGPSGERPLYVLAGGLSLTALALWWQTSGPLLWSYDGLLRPCARFLQILGVLVAAWAMAVLGLGELFGCHDLKALRKGTQPPGGELTALPPFRWTRHPINLGLLLFLLATPDASLDRVLMIAGLSAWLLLSAPFEERDAALSFGPAYAQYMQRTPRWLPRFRRPAS